MGFPVLVSPFLSVSSDYLRVRIIQAFGLERVGLARVYCTEVLSTAIDSLVKVEPLKVTFSSWLSVGTGG